MDLQEEKTNMVCLIGWAGDVREAICSQMQTSTTINSKIAHFPCHVSIPNIRVVVITTSSMIMRLLVINASSISLDLVTAIVISNRTMLVIITTCSITPE